ncbi:MAG: Lrp/AsnC family transcriptional regulator [Candidatus Eremiobacteraeota bacterium]|nr:Lrp/AsnC family transcriptional regulator [Candidatus Eremiobacteraeota bacterium]
MENTQRVNVFAAPVGVDDPVNAAILRVSEDRIAGFLRDPLGEIAARSGVPPDAVIERIAAMLRAGTIRRVRQTLLATNLAHGALVAWQIAPEKLDAAFDFMFEEDPFSGHVVIRTTDSATPGSSYRLWTTLKVPQGYSLEKHAEYLRETVGASAFRLMPAKRLFALGVGHVRRRGLEPGSRADVPAEVQDTHIVALDARDWQALVALKREFAPDELQRDLWEPRAREAGLPLGEFYAIAESLHARGVIGRFSTFLEHVKPTDGAQRVTRYNALFHWQVPPGRELDAGREVGRHHVMTHAYWREGGPEFRNVNVMGVAHGLDKDLLLAHKAAIDEHLREAGIAVGYTNVFWGGRSEIKPSEIAPQAFEAWYRARNVDPETMRNSFSPQLRSSPLK